MSEDIKHRLEKMSEEDFKHELTVKIPIGTKINDLFFKKIINEVSRDQLLMQLRHYSIEDPNFECLALIVDDEKFMSNYDDFIKEELKDRKAVLNVPVPFATLEQINKVKQLIEGDDFVPVTFKEVEEAKESFIKVIDSKCIN